MLIQFPGIFLESESCLTGVDKMNVCTSFLTGISWGDSGKEKIRAGEREDEVGCGCRRSCAALLSPGVLWLEESVLLPQRSLWQQAAPSRMLNWEGRFQNNPAAIMSFFHSSWLLGSVSRALMVRGAGHGLPTPSPGFMGGISMQELCCGSHSHQITHLAAGTCKRCPVFLLVFFGKIIFMKLLLLKSNKKVAFFSLLLTLSAPLLPSQLQLGARTRHCWVVFHHWF